MTKSRFDIHVNLGSFPGSQKGSAQRFISPKEMSEYFKREGITHSLVLYNRDEYELLRDLISQTETKVYGVQCVFGPDQDRPTDMSKPIELDVNNPERSFLYGGGCYGIKMASNRGWWIRKKDKKVVSGIDYMDRYVSKILSQLPKNAIASFHTQGSESVTVTASPMGLNTMAWKNPHVKFIMNHGGDYGPAFRTVKPSDEKIRGREKIPMYTLARWSAHRMKIRGGFELTETMFNVFNDMSCWTQEKGYVCRDYTQWCVGSDFPFEEDKITYTTEREKFLKYTDYIPDDQAVLFFEQDLDELVERSLDRHKQHIDNIKQVTDERREERKRTR